MTGIRARAGSPRIAASTANPSSSGMTRSSSTTSTPAPSSPSRSSATRPFSASTTSWPMLAQQAPQGLAVQQAVIDDEDPAADRGRDGGRRRARGRRHATQRLARAASSAATTRVMLRAGARGSAAAPSDSPRRPRSSSDRAIAARPFAPIVDALPLSVCAGTTTRAGSPAATRVVDRGEEPRAPRRGTCRRAGR